MYMQIRQAQATTKSTKIPANHKDWNPIQEVRRQNQMGGEEICKHFKNSATTTVEVSRFLNHWFLNAIEQALPVVIDAIKSINN